MSDRCVSRISRLLRVSAVKEFFSRRTLNIDDVDSMKN